MKGQNSNWSTTSTSANTADILHVPSKLKNYVNHAQANIFVPIELFQETQANIEDKQIQISTGGAQRYKLKKYSNIDIGLSTLKHQFLPT